MPRLRETLALVLLALLPFHAFGVTVLTKLIAGPGHPPLPVLALWKEALLGFVIVLAFVEACSSRTKNLESRIQNSKFKIQNSVDVIDVFILALIALSLVLLAFGRPSSFGSFALGFKYDFVPLIAFVMLRRVEWSQMFRARVVRVILWVGGIVAAYGILSFFLPQQFFVWLGYSDLHSLYVPDGPLAAFQQLGGSGVRRIQSVMSGPNQLGLWLLLPFSLALAHVLPRVANRPTDFLPRERGYFLLVGLALMLTFSRSAWLAALVMFIAAVVLLLPRRTTMRVLSQLALLLVVGMVFFFATSDILTRVASSRDHLLRPIVAIQSMIASPLGEGLGTAGPARNRTSDTCVYLEFGDDPSWAADRPDLCVFVGGAQVQPAPTTRACSCPFLTENWYLQLGVELGVLGFVLFVALTFLMLKRLRNGQSQKSLSTIHYPLSTFLMFLGISVASLFLHAWEDSAVAWTVWVLAASCFLGEGSVRRFVEPHADLRL